MQYARLGRTGLKVSRICLGTMTFGTQTSEADAGAIMDRASELGVNFVDSSNNYPIPYHPDGPGRTEEILGRWLQGAAGLGQDPLPAYALVLLVEMAVALLALVCLARVNLRQFREDTGRTLNKVLALELG